MTPILSLAPHIDRGTLEQIGLLLRTQLTHNFGGRAED